jgi:hypothetical protein
MEDQLIKLHDEFVDKGMEALPMILIKFPLRIHDRNVGYVLLDMQTWLREEHDIYLEPKYYYQYVGLSKTKKFFVNLTILKIVNKNKESEDFEKISVILGLNKKEWIVKGLQEAIKLIE